MSLDWFSNNLRLEEVCPFKPYHSLNICILTVLSDDAVPGSFAVIREGSRLDVQIAIKSLPDERTPETSRVVKAAPDEAAPDAAANFAASRTRLLANGSIDSGLRNIGSDGPFCNHFREQMRNNC
jgi:hypothetical protein